MAVKSMSNQVGSHIKPILMNVQNSSNLSINDNMKIFLQRTQRFVRICSFFCIATFVSQKKCGTIKALALDFTPLTLRIALKELHYVRPKCIGPH